MNSDLMSRSRMIHKLEHELRIITTAAQEAQKREATAKEALKTNEEVNRLIIMALVKKYGTRWELPDQTGAEPPIGTMGCTLTDDELASGSGRFIVQRKDEEGLRHLIFVPLSPEEEAAFASASAAGGNGGAHLEPARSGPKLVLP